MTVEQLLAIVLPDMEEMTEEERVEVVNKIREKFCMHCGVDHGDRILPCSCWNDE